MIRIYKLSYSDIMYVIRKKKKAEMQRWERDGVTGSEEGNGEGVKAILG